MSEEKRKNWQKIKEDSEMEELLHEGLEQDFLDEDEEDEVEKDVKPAINYSSHKELEEKLTLTEQKAHENWEKALRAVAELDNVRRRAKQDVANAHRFGVGELVLAILPGIDSLYQALQLAQNADDHSMIEGLELTLKLFLTALEKQNVQELNPEGEQFNPQEHEAMSIQERADLASNTVLTVFQKGYKLNDRVIRPARVIVSKAPS